MKRFSSKPLTSIETYIYGLKWRAQNHHCLGNAMFPVDLTELTALRKQYSKQVQPVTLTSLLIKAVALTIKANPGANRVLFQRFPLRRRIVDFNVIDVSVTITRLVHDEQLTFIGTIRGADTLSIAEIQDELSHLQNDPPEQSPVIQKLEKLRRAPRFAVSLYHWLMSRSPGFYLKNAGTCGLVPMEAMSGGHFFPIGPSSAIFGIGGIGDEVVARDGVPAVRRMMQVSLTLDNYVVSGPKGVGVTQTFQNQIESGSFVKSEMTGNTQTPLDE